MTKPLGLRPCRFPSKTDHHIREKHRKVLNWWEGERSGPNKARAKRECKNEIESQIMEANNDQAL